MSLIIGSAVVATSMAAETIAEQAPAVAAAPAPTPTPATTSIIWYGDFRYRFEKVGQEGQVPTNLIQNRIRARMGLKADLGDNTIVDFRLATGPGRASTNQTLGGSNNEFANYSILLDRAYFSWGFLEGVKVSAGRIPNPFWAPGGSDLVWDADLNFDGMALTGESKGSTFTPFVSTGLFWANKSSSASPDMKLVSLQAGTKIKIDDSWKAGIAIAYQRYISIIGRTNPFGSSAAASALSGNTTTGASNNIWVNEYNLLNFGPEIQTLIDGKPLTFFADIVRNTAVDSENKGFLVGLKYGELKKVGDIMFGYDYRRLEKDAAVDTFTDGDAANGGTDLKSNRISVGYKAKKNWNVAAAYFFGDKFLAVPANTVSRNKIHFDLLFAF